MKTALMLVDGDEKSIKIVVGSMLKVIKFGEMSLPHNSRFIDKLFQDANVFVVEKAVPTDRQSFDAFAAGFASGAPEAHEGAHDQAHEPQAQKATVPASPARPSGLSLYRSTAQSYITVDDLFVGDNIRGIDGMKRALAIAPNKAVNLSALDPEAVKKSAILQHLINQGVLVPCTPAEAVELDQLAERESRKYERSLEIVSDVSGSGSAARLAEAISSGQVSGTLVDDRVETINVEDGPQRRDSSPRFEPSMEDMLKAVGAMDDGPPVQEQAPRPRRQLEARPKPQVSGMPARAISFKR